MINAALMRADTRSRPRWEGYTMSEEFYIVNSYALAVGAGGRMFYNFGEYQSYSIIITQSKTFLFSVYDFLKAPPASILQDRAPRAALYEIYRPLGGLVQPSVKDYIVSRKEAKHYVKSMGSYQKVHYFELLDCGNFKGLTRKWLRWGEPFRWSP